MVRLLISSLCLALGSGDLSAADPLVPGSASVDLAPVTGQLEIALERLKSADRTFAHVRETSRTRLNENQRQAALARTAGCTADVLKARDALRRAIVDLRFLALKVALSGRDDWRAGWLTRLADRAQRVTGDRDPKNAPVPETLAVLDTISTWLKCDAPSADDVSQVIDGLAVAISEVSSVNRDVSQSLSQERLAEMMRVILANQRDVERNIWVWRDRYVPQPQSVEPIISQLAVVELKKGDRAKLSHSIAWRKYQEDELDIVLTASDPSIVVPAKLRLDYEKHQFRFEYEIRAGDKAGDFTVTLKPALGDPVEVKVTVK